MKKTKVLLFAIMLTLVVGVLVGCNKKETKLSKEEITKSRLMSSTTLTTLFEEKIDYINPYINVFEVFFGSVGPEITLLSEGVLEGYTHYEQITYTDSLNNKIVYHYHYIETNDDDEIEQKGVIIHNDETYYVEISIETEEDEIEKEYLIYKDKDRKDKDYISLEIEKDLEDGDQSYQYYIYKDGNEVHKVTVDLEQDDDQSLSLKTVVDVKNRLKFTLELRQVEDKLAGKYKIESDRVESGKVTLKIIESDGLLYYEYSISNKVIKRARSLR